MGQHMAEFSIPSSWGGLNGIPQWKPAPYLRRNRNLNYPLLAHLTNGGILRQRENTSPGYKGVDLDGGIQMFYPPGQVMQQPTHSRLHVRDARDAHTVFEAVRLGLLRPVLRRLNEIERSMFITSGAIFVWEESEDDLGLKRWTDGRVWSQSRMREPYLFYDEKSPSDDNQATEQPPRSTGNFRFVDGISRGGATSPALSHYDRSEQHPTGLVKQAYSAWVLEHPNTKPRKWHLTAYFTYADLPRIPTVDQDPTLRGVTVPVGMYRSGKARSRNSDASLPASPSTSPPPYGRSSAGTSSQVSPSRIADPSAALPSLHTALAPRLHDTHAARWGHDPRHAEDQRVIQILNSRHTK
ncbi:hypothetical protein BV25DRAFT_427505 [Artomyces pyxidatus]|uniref:Uncharacterized protein n=1 Tax=Artomyces pyxidatus TaxID=48021 RepID=A0ACB8T677_9AGAM|nr:hypothetical protein BV25DRAFT_427505 [Artomyces pyxidatus]